MKAEEMGTTQPCCAASRPGSWQDGDSSARATQATWVDSSGKGSTLGMVQLEGVSS